MDTKQTTFDMNEKWHKNICSPRKRFNKVTILSSPLLREKIFYPRRGPDGKKSHECEMKKRGRTFRRYSNDNIYQLFVKSRPNVLIKLPRIICTVLLSNSDRTYQIKLLSSAHSPLLCKLMKNLVRFLYPFVSFCILSRCNLSIV